MSSTTASRQTKKLIVRLAKLTIDPAQLEPYKVMLKEQADIATRGEPGVLTLFAVSKKLSPRTLPFWKSMPIRRLTGRTCKPRIF